MFFPALLLSAVLIAAQTAAAIDCTCSWDYTIATYMWEDQSPPYNQATADLDGSWVDWECTLTSSEALVPVSGPTGTNQCTWSFDPTANFYGWTYFVYKVDGDCRNAASAASTSCDGVLFPATFSRERWMEFREWNDSPTAIASPTTYYVNEDETVVITLQGDDVDELAAHDERDLLIYRFKGAPVGTLKASVANMDDSPITLAGTPELSETGTSAQLKFTPAANLCSVAVSPGGGQDDLAVTDSHPVFIFEVEDDRGWTSGTTPAITVQVTCVNDDPVATPQTGLTTLEDESITITLGAYDEETDEADLVFEVHQLPASGTLYRSDGTTPLTVGAVIGANRQVVLAPATNYNGLIDFYFKVTDRNAATSVPAVVEVTATPVNDPPAGLGDQTLSITEDDTAVQVTLAASDIDGDAFDCRIETMPAKGTLTSYDGTAISGPNYIVKTNNNCQVLYTPDADGNGVAFDSFVYFANDGQVDSLGTGTITFDVAPVNDAPESQSETVDIDEDVLTDITLVGTDVDGDTLTWTVVTTVPTSKGSLFQSDGTTPVTSNSALPAGDNVVRYQGPLNANGDAYTTLSYQVTDPDGLPSAVATVTIDITPVNDKPSASDDLTIESNEGDDVTITFSGADVDGPSEEYVVSSLPGAGTGSLKSVPGGTTFTVTPAQVSDPSHQVLFTPASAGAKADDYLLTSFTYRAHDSIAASDDLATVDLYIYAVPTVSAVDPANGPTAGGDVVTVHGDHFMHNGGTADVAAINGIDCQAINVLDTTSLECTLPAGVGENLAVSVTNRGMVGTSGPLFSYDPPVVTSVAPTRPFEDGVDTTVGLLGNNFGPVGTVAAAEIDGVPCTTTTHTSNTRVECVVPSGSGINLNAAVQVGSQDSAANTLFSYLDTTPPVQGAVTDVDGADQDYQTTLDDITFEWSGISDPDTALQNIQFALGTVPGGTSLTTGFQDLGVASGAGSHTYTPGAAFTNGVRIFVTLRSTNAHTQFDADLFTLQTSDGVLLDNTEPAAGTVLGPLGSGDADEYWATADSLPISWSGFTDDESGIVEYSYELVEVGVGSDVVAGPTSMGLATSTTLTGLALETGESYQVRLTVTNAAGLSLVHNSATTIHVDLTAPVANNIFDGTTGADASYSTSASTLGAFWDDFTEPESGPLTYTWEIQTLDGSTVVRPSAAAGSAGGSISASDLTGDIATGEEYRVAITATNQAGLATTAYSNGIMVDLLPPTGGSPVKDGSNSAVDLVWQTSTTQADATWAAFADDDSGIATIEIGLASDSGCSDAAATYVAAATGTSGSVTTFPAWTCPARRYVCVRATDNAGLSTVRVSTGIRCDDTDPTVGVVSDGTSPGIDIDNTFGKTSISITWTAWTDDDAPITGYEYELRYADNTVIQAFTSSGGSTAATVTGLSLEVGDEYKGVVRGTNAAGATSTAESDGVEVVAVADDGVVVDGTDDSDDLDYQTSLTEISATWFAFDADTERFNLEITDSGDNVVHTITSVTTDSGDPYPGTGTTPETHTQGGLTLADGETYKVEITGIINVGGTDNEVSKFSNGVQVDTSDPVGGTVNDIDPALACGSGDVTWHGSDTEISACWSGFSDDGAPLVDYRYRVMLGATDVTGGFSSLGLATSFSHTFGAGVLQASDLATTHTYTVEIEAFNQAGLSTTVASNGVAIDTTTPVGTTVTHDNGAYQRDTANLALTWAAFQAPSGIADYTIQIGTGTVGAADALAEVSLASTGVTHTQALALTEGETYFVRISGVSTVGLKGSVDSTGVTIDNTAPVAGTVSTGTAFATTATVIDSATTVSATWRLGSTATAGTFHDAHTTIKRFEMAVSDQNDCSTQLEAWVDVSDLSAQITYELVMAAGAMTHGQTYYTCVRATDQVDLDIVGVSDPFIVDLTPPVENTAAAYGGSAVAGPSSQFYSSVQDRFTVSFDFADAESDIETFEVALGTSAGATDVLAFTAAGSGTDTSYTHVFASTTALAPGTSYYVTVRATNGVGMRTLSADINPLIIDTTPPVAGVVTYVVPVAGSAFTPTDDEVEASWTAFTDAESSIQMYAWAIGIDGGDAESVLAFTDLTDSTLTETLSALSLTQAETYIVTVRATNYAGLATQATARATIDTTPPTINFIREVGLSGTNCNDIAFLTTTSELSACWDIEDAESGITSFVWAIGDDATGLNLGPTTTTLASEASATGLTLAEVMQYVTVTATNGAGDSVTGTSNGVLIDVTPPTATTINDGSAVGTDIDWQEALDANSANWDAFTDNGAEPSGIAGYQMALFRDDGTANGAQVLAFAAATSATTAEFSEDLTIGETYFVKVRCTDNAGNAVTVQSDGFIPDNTPPVASRVDDGPVKGNDIDYQTYADRTDVNWDAFTDAESGTITYRVVMTEETSLATFDEGAAAWQDVADPTCDADGCGAAEFSATLTDGNEYFMVVEATNEVGLTSMEITNGVVVDTTGPVVVGDALDVTLPDETTDIDIQYDRENIAAAWPEFTDPESGITGYTMSVGTTAGGDDVQAASAVGCCSSKLAPAGGLDLGTVYYSTITATNGAGSTTSIMTDGVRIISNVSPLGDEVRDGTGSDLAFQRSATHYDVNWDAFDPRSDIPEVAVGSYEWMLLERINATYSVNVTSWATLDASVTSSGADVALEHRHEYFARVKATNLAGVVSQVVSSNGVVVDTTGPSVDAVLDVDATAGSVANLDIDYTRESTRLKLRCGARDPESDIRKVQYSFGTSPGGAQIVPWTTLPSLVGSAANGFDVVVVNQTIAQGATVYASIKAFNGAGASKTQHSDGVLLDGTPPVISNLTDGQLVLPADVTHSAVAELDANMGLVTDPESGVASLQFRVISDASGSVSTVHPWTTLELNAMNMTTRKNGTTLNINAGTSYKVSVRATNLAGAVAEVTTNGVVYDPIAPEDGVVIFDGAERSNTSTANSTGTTSPRDIDYTSFDRTHTMQWGKFRDLHSGVARYEVAIGRVVGRDTENVVDWTPVTGFADPERPSYTFENLALEDGAFLVSRVRAFDYAGNERTRDSDGFVVDLSPPAPGIVVDGADLTADVNETASNVDAYIWSWTGFTDSESSIRGYTFCLGTAPEVCDVVDPVDLPSPRLKRYSVDGAMLANETLYFATVVAHNRAGLSTPLSSDGVVIVVAGGSGTGNIDAPVNNLASNVDDNGSPGILIAAIVGSAVIAAGVAAFLIVRSMKKRMRKTKTLSQRDARRANMAGTEAPLSTDDVFVNDLEPSSNLGFDEDIEMELEGADVA